MSKMKFQFQSINRFLAPLWALRDLNDVLDLTFSDASCTATVLDSTHVSLSFVSWICASSDVSEDVCIAIKLSSLVTALGLASNPQDAFTIEIASADADTITVLLDGGDTTVDLRLLENVAESMSRPGYEDAVSFRFETPRIRDVCKELSSLGDTVTLRCQDSNLVLQTTGDVGNAKITMRPTQLVHSTASSAPVSVGLRYLNSIMKAYTISSTVVLGLMDGMPLRVSFESPDVKMHCFVAPKLEDDSLDGHME